jgi:hypothetical protein
LVEALQDLAACQVSQQHTLGPLQHLVVLQAQVRLVLLLRGLAV